MNTHLENLIICKCLKVLLLECGFENNTSLAKIDDETLAYMEEYINKNRVLFENLPKCHKNVYNQQAIFKFLPAHKISLLNLKNEIRDSSKTLNMDNPAFSRILSELVKTALTNANRTPNNHKYSNVLFDFAIYIFIMGGRALYEVLNANLPLPAVSTISK